MRKQMKDRISGLPKHILHEILCLLSEKEAVRTCVLSKSWRDIVSTRPNLVFRQHLFKFQPRTLMSFLFKTLHRRWHHSQDQNHLSIQNFVLEICYLDNDSESKTLLDKWIPIVFLNMGLKEFTLHSFPKAFDVPWSVFKSKCLRKLVLFKCNLIRNPFDENIILCKQLQILSLTKVNITDDAFQNIMSSCPLIKSATIHDCDGLRNLKVNKTSSYNLNHFDIRYSHDDSNNEEDHNIEIDVPTIKAIKISRCPNWNRHHNYFPHLESLYLSHVRLSPDSFSSNFPCLQVLTLDYCYGFEALQLSSRSIKHLTIWDHKSLELDINAPNLLKFDYKGILPESISVKTTSSEWKSSITLWPYQSFGQDASSWLHKLHEMLKALSHSDICLYLRDPHFADHFTNGELYEPAYVRLLQYLGINARFSSSTPNFVTNLFCICRPRNISRTLFYQYSNWESKSGDTQLTELIWRILVTERERRDYVWQQDLEEVSIEAFDWDGQNWNPVVGTGLIECAVFLPNKKRQFRFTLKWRSL